MSAFWNRNVATATQISKDDVEDDSGKKVEVEQVKEVGNNVKEETEEKRRKRIQWEADREAWLQREAKREARLKEAEEEAKVPTLTFGNI